MDFDIRVKMAVYQHFAETGAAPAATDLANRVDAGITPVLEAYRRLAVLRVLVLEADGSSIRMAPPFSGVPTQHVVEVGGNQYFANCAWDALGVPAALGKAAVIHSRCGQSGQPFHLKVSVQGPESSDWLFHSLLPARKWWDDIVFT